MATLLVVPNTVTIRFTAEDYFSAYQTTVLAHCRHYGVPEVITPEEETMDAEQAVFANYQRYRLAEIVMALDDYPQYRDGCLRALRYEVAVAYTTSHAPNIPHTIFYKIPEDSLMHPRPPVVCEEADCPVEGFHYRGLYMHRGKLNSKLSPWGFSDPPPKVWEALKRIREKKRNAGDQEMVERFACYHTWLATRVGETSVEEEEEEEEEGRLDSE